jgi:hypothetical protein
MIPAEAEVPDSQSHPRNVADWIPELDALHRESRAALRAVSNASTVPTKLPHQVDWHVRGVLHHMMRMIESYTEFAREVSARATIEAAPSILVMYAPSYQILLFEFYALVNLSKISLDSLTSFLRAVFVTDFRQMPKGLADVLEGQTDCPLYRQLREHPVFGYLRDMRNCIVHYRSLATSDNAIVVADDVPPDEEERLTRGQEWFEAMARAKFRRTDNGVVVNVYVPDRVFEVVGTNRRLARFTYVARYNILSQSMNFTRLTVQSLLYAMALMIDPGKPTFTWSR